MNLNIELSETVAAALQAKARARGLSPDRYASQVLEDTFSPAREMSDAAVFEQGLGLFGSPEDAALLDEVVELAYEERRRPGRPSPSL